jgi:hypothetical protein
MCDNLSNFMWTIQGTSTVPSITIDQEKAWRSKSRFVLRKKQTSGEIKPVDGVHTTFFFLDRIILYLKNMRIIVYVYVDL